MCCTRGAQFLLRAIILLLAVSNSGGSSCSQSDISTSSLNISITGCGRNSGGSNGSSSDCASFYFSILAMERVVSFQFDYCPSKCFALIVTEARVIWLFLLADRCIELASFIIDAAVQWMNHYTPTEHFRVSASPSVSQWYSKCLQTVCCDGFTSLCHRSKTYLTACHAACV